MSGAMRKMGVYLGLLEDSDRYDDDFEVHDEQAQTGPVARQASVASLSDRRRPAVATPVPSGPRVAELSRITTLHPSTYNEARIIGENFREGVPVIMNLSEMSDADAKRLVDFSAGLVFAVHGSIERVTNKVFLLSPAHIEVTSDDKEVVAGSGLFNQS